MTSSRTTRRRLLLATATLAVPLAGCSGTNTENGRLDLTVHNERSTPIDADITVTGPDGETYAAETDRIDSGVARAFEVTVGTDGRHELTVTGNGWDGSLGWDAGICRLFDGQVTVTESAVETAGECVDER